MTDPETKGDEKQANDDQLAITGLLAFIKKHKRVAVTAPRRFWSKTRKTRLIATTLATEGSRVVYCVPYWVKHSKEIPGVKIVRSDTELFDLKPEDVDWLIVDELCGSGPALGHILKFTNVFVCYTPWDESTRLHPAQVYCCKALEDEDFAKQAGVVKALKRNLKDVVSTRLHANDKMDPESRKRFSVQLFAFMRAVEFLFFIAITVLGLLAVIELRSNILTFTAWRVITLVVFVLVFFAWIFFFDARYLNPGSEWTKFVLRHIRPKFVSATNWWVVYGAMFTLFEYVAYHYAPAWIDDQLTQTERWKDLMWGHIICAIFVALYYWTDVLDYVAEYVYVQFYPNDYDAN